MSKHKDIFRDDNCLTRGIVRVEWSDLGEGQSGEFNANDKDDAALLRFDVSYKTKQGWEACEDASYCTQFPAEATSEQKREGLKLLMDELYDSVLQYPDSSVKKLCERLSWISLKSLKDNAVTLGKWAMPSATADVRVKDGDVSVSVDLSEISWGQGRNGMRDLGQLKVWTAGTEIKGVKPVYFDLVTRKKGVVINGGLCISVADMDRLVEGWLKGREGPGEDEFLCEGCNQIFDVEDSIKPSGKKGGMYCPDCAKGK